MLPNSSASESPSQSESFLSLLGSFGSTIELPPPLPPLPPCPFALPPVPPPELLPPPGPPSPFTIGGLQSHPAIATASAAASSDTLDWNMVRRLLGPLSGLGL